MYCNTTEHIYIVHIKDTSQNIVCQWSEVLERVHYRTNKIIILLNLRQQLCTNKKTTSQRFLQLSFSFQPRHLLFYYWYILLNYGRRNSAVVIVLAPTNVAQVRYQLGVTCEFGLLLVLALPQGFFSGFSGSPPSTKPNIFRFQFNQDKRPA